MFQCKAYLNTDLVWMTMLVCLSVEVDMFSAFPYYVLANKITINFDSKFHDSYLMQRMHNKFYPKWYNTVTTPLNSSSFLMLKLHLTNVTLNM